MSKLNKIESEVKSAVEQILSSTEILGQKKITHDLVFNSSGNGDNYFSEIEITFWKNHNIIDVISIILFTEGKCRSTTDIFIEWFTEELKSLLE